MANPNATQRQQVQGLTGPPPHFTKGAHAQAKTAGGSCPPPSQAFWWFYLEGNGGKRYHRWDFYESIF